jgi:hypothetical protein
MLSSDTPENASRWLLLLHQLPSKPAYVRVKLWRRLQALGAVALKNAVHALPATGQAREDFEWLRKEIVQAGGEAVICEARLVDGLTDGETRGLFNAARDGEYEEIAKEARQLLSTIKKAKKSESRNEFKAQYTRLKARHSQNVDVDFFDAMGRLSVEDSMTSLQQALSETPPSPKPAAKSGRENLKDHIWVTRQGVHIDRIACAWMIKRFIDEKAAFKFVQAKTYVPSHGELRFDMFDAEFTHEGDRCSFEVLLAHSRLDDPALRGIAEIVHDIDVKDGKFGREEAAGVKTLIDGICAGTDDDEERLTRGAVLFDDLYRMFRKKRNSRRAAAAKS